MKTYNNTCNPDTGAGASKPPEPELATKKDLARRYSVSTRTVDHWIATKLIPVLRFGPRLVRFPLRECDRALAERFKINARKERR